MTRLAFFTLVISLSLSNLLMAAEGHSQSLENTVVRITEDRQSVASMLAQIERQSHFTFTFPADIGRRQISGTSAGRIAVADLLKKLKDRYRINFTQLGELIALSQLPVPQAAGTISGKILDSNGQPLPGAGIRVEQTGQTTQSAVDGAYRIDLPAGKYTLVISYISFRTRRITDVTVTSGSNTPLDVAMQETANALGEVVVTASYKKASVEGLYARQKNAAGMTDGISAEQIRATPDNNTAQVLKRVSGLTVQDEKFVTVRGLSERYNNVTLNGASLPSTEPNRRNFAFDIIPSALIDNIVVSKTATPDQSAEFAGGLVQVSTRDIPDENYMSLTVGTGYNTNSAGKPFYSYKLGKAAPFGFAGAGRDWWTSSRFPTFEYRTVSQDIIQRAQLSKQVPNTFGLGRVEYRPVQNLQFSLGRRIEMKNNRLLAFTFAATNRHEETIADEQRFFPTFFYYSDSLSRAYNYNSALGGLAGAAFQAGTNKLSFKSLYNRRLSSQTSDYYGANYDARGTVNFSDNILLVNDLWQNRLEGEHVFGKQRIRVDWSADMARVRRDQPDSRVANKYTLDASNSYYSLDDAKGFLSDGLTVFNARLKETKKNAAVNVTVPFRLLSLEHRIKAGYNLMRRDADAASMGLRLYFNGKAGEQDYNEFLRQTYGLADLQLARPEFMAPGMLYYKLTGIGGETSPDDYKGKQSIDAAYLMGDFKLLQVLRLVGGVRIEQNRMELAGITYDYNTGYPVDSVIKYNTRDWLPSANLTWSVNSRMNVRAAWSKTLARADFRERSTYRYYDPHERFIINGAVGLRDSYIYNTDLRWEFYPSAGELVSFSLFHKKFKSPVELTSTNDMNGGLNNFYFNLESSTNKGFEVDFRKSLGFLASDKTWLQDIYMSGNLTVMKSNVVTDPISLLGGGTQKRERPLIGLSPYAINGGLGYFGAKFGINASYNRYGRRIVIAGAFPWQDQYENPRDVIDIQLNARFLKKRLEARFNISDLLQQKLIIYQNITSAAPGASTGFQTVEPEQRFNVNVNNDPKGQNYNPDLDYTRYRAFRGRNLSLNLTYNF